MTPLGISSNAEYLTGFLQDQQGMLWLPKGQTLCASSALAASVCPNLHTAPQNREQAFSGQ